MKPAKLHPEENLRIELLQALNILDSAPESHLNAITQVAASICGTPVALVSLVDRHRQWFKANVGMPASVVETSRDSAFCAHAILEKNLFEVTDALSDERFRDNPLVTGAPNIRFYAGQPLIVGGLPVGTLCVIDQAPRELTPMQRDVLQYLGRLTQSILEERRLRAMTDESQRGVEEELELAREVLINLTRCERQSTSLRKVILPASKFSGDLVTNAYSPDGRLYGLFADVTGHGLASALYQIPAVDCFKEHVMMGSTVGVIARAINARLKALLRSGNFMAAIVFCQDEQSRCLTIWNGGMPDAWLLDERGAMRHAVKSTHLALGVLPDETFDPHFETIDDPRDMQLLMISDGVLEAFNEDGEEYGEERARRAIAESAHDERIESLLATVFAHQGNALQHDDMAVAALDLARA